MQSQIRFNRVPEKVRRRSREGSGEGLGGFGAGAAGQVQQGSEEGSRRKVWEALVQSQVRFNRVRRRFQEGFRRRFRRRYGRIRCSWSGSTRFLRRFLGEGLQVQQGSGEGSEKVPGRFSGEGSGEGLGGFGGRNLVAPDRPEASQTFSGTFSGTDLALYQSLPDLLRNLLWNLLRDPVEPDLFWAEDLIH